VQRDCGLATGALVHWLVTGRGNQDRHQNGRAAIIEAEPDKKVLMEGKSSTKHASSVDLDFEVQVKPFRPGTGYITLGADDTYYYNFICITKLTVTGQIAIDGESKQVTGSAYYNHQWFNISPISAFHHWLWGRQNVGSYNVMIYDMVAAERLGLDQIPLFTIDDQQGNRVFENTSAKGMDITVLDSYVQKQTGKRYPKTVRYAFDRGDTDIEYTISEPQEINIIDLYGDASEPLAASSTRCGCGRPTHATSDRPNSPSPGAARARPSTARSCTSSTTPVSRTRTLTCSNRSATRAETRGQPALQ